MDSVSKRKRGLLIVAAGPLQVPAIEEARELGLRSITVDANPLAPGMKLADSQHVVDILDAPAVTKIAQAENVAGVMTLCSDAPVRTVAAVAEKLGFPALSPMAAANATDKRLMRGALFSAGVPVPRFWEVESKESALAAAEKAKYPLALKVACSSGSRGIYRVHSREDLVDRYSQAREHQPFGSLLIEEWMEGAEVSVEGACWGDRVHVVQVTDKLLFPGEFPVEAGHSQPSRLPDKMVELIRETTENGVRALSLTNCAFHAELKVTVDGPKIVEIGARLGGDRIATHLTPISTGVNLIRAAIAIAIGEVPDLAQRWVRGAAIRYFHAVGQGMIDKVEGLEEIRRLEGVELLYAASERDGPLRPGLRVGHIRSSLDRYGHVLFSGVNAAQAIERAEHAAQLVRFRLSSPS